MRAMGFVGRAIVAALLVAAGASAAGNVSLVPSGFTSAEMVKRFHGFGGWHVEDRSCDKYVYGRLWDADCMKRRPPAGEILPLLVTGTPYTGTRSVAELFAAMDVEADHEAYADMATVSAVHAFNDFVGGVPYPRSSEQTPWWKTRIISNRYDYQNAFRPRWKHAVHLTRCPLRVVQRLMGAGAPVIRFLEAFTEWPRLRYRRSGASRPASPPKRPATSSRRARPSPRARDCLRARVLFGQPYRSLKCCFRCCVLYWLESTRLGANIRFHAKREKTVLDEVRGKHDTVWETSSRLARYNKANPDDGDYGLDPS
ncbi:hypothetical protein SO694_00010176 [Aureococcus anophagefferens]|uniref:Uncharacterized protein n=1 Tax=Aureococcus anophagefferens TaxID=44056 RepID=A0ABR1GFC5_AURAN